MGGNACHHPTQLILPLVQVCIATLAAPTPLFSPHRIERVERPADIRLEGVDKVRTASARHDHRHWDSLQDVRGVPAVPQIIGALPPFVFFHVESLRILSIRRGPHPRSPWAHPGRQRPLRTVLVECRGHRRATVVRVHLPPCLGV